MLLKELKIFKEANVQKLPGYIYKSQPTDEDTTTTATHITSHSVEGAGVPSLRILRMSDPLTITRRKNAQFAREELKRTLHVITSSLSFSPEVVEERVIPELLPYDHSGSSAGKNHTKLFTPPSGVSRTLSRKSSRGPAVPTSHLPCILRNCKRTKNHSHNQMGMQFRSAGRALDGSCQSISQSSGTGSSSPAPEEVFEDELFLSKVSASTVELIVSKMTQGAQQDRLRRKFQLDQARMN